MIPAETGKPPFSDEVVIQSLVAERTNEATPSRGTSTPKRRRHWAPMGVDLT